MKYVMEFLVKSHTTQTADVIDVLEKISQSFLGISEKQYVKSPGVI